MFLLLVVTTGAWSAVGQEAPAAGEPVSVMKLAHPLDGPGSEAITRIWGNCVHFYHAGKYSDLLVELDKLSQTQVDSGILNLTHISSTLVLMGQKILTNSPDDADLALSIVKYGQMLSPDVADFHFARSNLVWSHDKGQVGEYVREYFTGLRLSLTHLPSLHAMLLGSIGIVWAVGFLVMCVFSIIVLIRHLSLFSHDVGHFFPRGLSKLQLNVAGLILLFVPFLADLGAVPLFAFWWVALWAYQTRHERIVTVLLVLFVYLWPIMNGLFVNSLAFSGGPADRTYRCHNEVCTWAEVTELEKLADDGIGGGATLLAVGSAHLKAANQGTAGLEQAFEIFKRGSKEVVGPLNGAFNLGMGNVFFLKGMARCNRAHGTLDVGLDDFQSANKHYDLAISQEPREWGAYYNKYKVLAVLGEEEEARIYLDRATDISAARVTAFEKRSLMPEDAGCTAKFNSNRELTLPTLTLPIIWSDKFGLGEDSVDMARLPLAHGLLIGPMDCWMLALLATGVLLAVIAMTLGRRFLKPSTRCIKCGATSCLRCRPELAGTGLCNQCVYYKIRSSYVDPKETWMREKRIENRIRFRRKFEAFLTFVAPGTGHMLRGRPVRGILFMWVLLSSLAGVFLFKFVSGLAAAPLSALAAASIVGTAFWSVIAFVAFFLALIDIYSWR